MGFFSSRASSEPEALSSVPEKFDDVPELPEPLNTTIIAEGVTVIGSMKGEGIIQVEGTVEGEIHLNGRIVVAPTGKIKGPMEATAIHVAGGVEGNILAEEQLVLEKTGVIDGDITTASFIIEDGGWLNGRTTMSRRGKEPRDRSASDLLFGGNYKLDSEEQTAST